MKIKNNKYFNNLRNFTVDRNENLIYLTALITPKRRTMDFKTYMEKQEALKHLIEKKRTGSPAQLASKLEISQRSVIRMITNLRYDGYNIAFNRRRNSYEFLDEDENLQVNEEEINNFRTTPKNGVERFYL